MEKTMLETIAKGYGISKAVFSNFILQRFPNEKDGSYVDTWARRFASGEPEVFMDSVSLAIYKKVVREDKKK